MTMTPFSGRVERMRMGEASVGGKAKERLHG